MASIKIIKEVYGNESRSYLAQLGLCGFINGCGGQKLECWGSSVWVVDRKRHQQVNYINSTHSNHLAGP